MIRNLSRLSLLLTGMIVFSVSCAFAEVRNGAVTMTPMAGYQVYDSNLDLDDGAAYGLAIGYNASKHWALEMDFLYAPSEADVAGGPDVNVVTITGNVLYHFMPEQSLVPFLLVGIGGLQYDIDDSGEDDEDFIANWGGGIKCAITPTIDLRLDLRHIIDFRSDNRFREQDDDFSNNFAAIFGVNFQFGGMSNAPVRISR